MNIKTISSRLPLSTKLSYGIGGFGKDFGLVVVNTFLFFYYTDVVNISAEIVGIVFLVARIWDIFADIIIAYLISVTKSRWGKYKPWILVGNILNGLSIAALFSAHNISPEFQTLYIVLTYIIWGTSFTLADAPFWSLLPTITLDKKEREIIMPWPRILASAANYLASGIGMISVHYLGQGNDGNGFFLFAIACAVLGVISAMTTCRWVTRNYKEDDLDEAHDFSLKKAFHIVFKNNQLIWLLTLAIFYIIATNITQALNIYYFTYAIGNQTLFSLFMLIGGVFGLGAIMFFSKGVDYFGREKIFIASLIAPIISCLCLFLSSLDSLTFMMTPLVFISGVAMGLSSALYWLMVFIMVADTIDYGDKKFNMRAEAISYSAHSLVIKLGASVTGFLVGFMLKMIHYTPRQQQTPETIMGLHLVYVVPSFLCLISLFIYLKYYYLNGSKLLEIQNTLHAKYQSVTSGTDVKPTAINVKPESSSALTE